MSNTIGVGTIGRIELIYLSLYVSIASSVTIS